MKEWTHHRPHSKEERKKERKLDEEKIDESPGKIPIIQNTQQNKRGKKERKGKEQIKRTQGFVKRFSFEKKTHPHQEFSTTGRLLQSTYHKGGKLNWDLGE